MLAGHYLKRWRDAGLIDGGTVARIADWEAAHRRPVWLWALSGMGALAIGLGVVALVGANWEDIPAPLKLSGDLLLTALCAVFVFMAWKREQAWKREIGALLLFGLAIGGIALIGQVYQLQSDPWQALVIWLVLCTPFLALVAFTRLVGVLWAAAVLATWLAAYEALERSIASLQELFVPPFPPPTETPHAHFFHLLLYLPACLMMVVATARRRWPPAADQGDLLLRLSLGGLVGAVSTTVVTVDSWLVGAGAPIEIWIGAAATLLAASVLWQGSGALQRRHAIALLGVSFAAWTAALSLALLWTGQRKVGFEAVLGLLFIVYWSAIGGLAARAGQRVLFGLAFTVVGVRLLILYFEAIGGLTATGFGLIGGGVLCLALTWAGWQLTRRMARGAVP